MNIYCVGTLFTQLTLGLNAFITAQGVSTYFVIHYLIKPTSQLKLRLKNIRFERKLLLPCILLGTSPALMQLTENMVAISFNTSLQKI